MRKKRERVREGGREEGERERERRTCRHYPIRMRLLAFVYARVYFMYRTRDQR